MLEKLLVGKYRLKEKLAIGPFYEVFKGKHHQNETEVLIKLEKKSLGESKIFNEVKLLKEIQG